MCERKTTKDGALIATIRQLIDEHEDRPVMKGYHALIAYETPQKVTRFWGTITIIAQDKEQAANLIWNFFRDHCTYGQTTTKNDTVWVHRYFDEARPTILAFNQFGEDV